VFKIGTWCQMTSWISNQMLVWIGLLVFIVTFSYIM